MQADQPPLGYSVAFNQAALDGPLGVDPYGNLRIS